MSLGFGLDSGEVTSKFSFQLNSDPAEPQTNFGQFTSMLSPISLLAPNSPFRSSMATGPLIWSLRMDWRMAIPMDSAWAPTPPQSRRALHATQLAHKLATKLSIQLTTWQSTNTAKCCCRRHLGLPLSALGAVTTRQRRGDSGDMDGKYAKAASQARPPWLATSSSRIPVSILNAEALHYAGSKMSSSTSTESISCLNSTVTVAIKPSALARRKLATSARTPLARSARLRH